MRLYALFCEVLARQAYYAAAFSPHVVDIDLIDKGLHNEPERLRAHLKERLATADQQGYDAILIGFGLCSSSTVGLCATRTPMVIPRAHDCITLFLGSKERYGEQFRENPGTYWYAPDYIERGGSESGQVALGAGDDSRIDEVYAEYVLKYGQDNADYLMEVMGAWQQHYNRAAYIEPIEMKMPDHRPMVRETAARRGWRFEELDGSILIVRDLVEGRWDDERFATIAPNHMVVATNDERIVGSTPCTEVTGNGAT